MKLNICVPKEIFHLFEEAYYRGELPEDINKEPCEVDGRQSYLYQLDTDTLEGNTITQLVKMSRDKWEFGFEMVLKRQ